MGNRGRFKDYDWTMPGMETLTDNTRIFPNDTIKISLLMDIRDKLSELVARKSARRRAPRKLRRKAK